MRTIIFALALAAPAATIGLTRQAADSCRVKLEDLERRQKAAGSPAPSGAVAFTESEINSYLNLGGVKLPVGLRDIRVRLFRGRVEAMGTVDLDAVKAHVPSSSSPLNPLWLLGGTTEFELKGKVESDKGFGQVDVEEVRLGPVSLPPSVVAQIVASSTKTADKPGGFDLLAPFRLPYGLKRVRIETGQSLVET